MKVLTGDAASCKVVGMTATYSTSELLGQLEDGISHLTTSEDWTRWLETQARFHNYSFQNSLLIAWQRPDASRVAGYGVWQGLGRQVRKGEKSIRILAPNLAKDPEDPDKKVLRGFRSVGVFDISQTDGDPLAEVCSRLTGAAPENMISALAAVAERIGFSVHFEEIGGETNGYCNASEKKIVVEFRNDPAQQAKTLVHELGHAILHCDPEGAALDRSIKELEAESVAYVVSAALGHDTSDYTFGYVAVWAGRGSEDSVKAVRKSGSRIQRAADKILHELEDAQS
jgi:antirestriction protein ArdC